MLFSDVLLDAGGRLEGHGAAWAFVEQFTMSLLDVRLDRVQSSEHHQATGASAGRRTTKGMSADVVLPNGSSHMGVGGLASHLYPIRRTKCKHVSSKCVWNSSWSTEHPHSGQTCGLQLR